MSDKIYISRSEMQTMLAQARLHEAEKATRKLDPIIFGLEDDISLLREQLSDMSINYERQHLALGRLIEILDAEPSIGDADMSYALESARAVWDTNV